MPFPGLLAKFAFLVLCTLLLAACGDDDDDGGLPLPGEEQADSGDDSGSDENGSDQGSDDIDLGDVPPPGEARLELDGQTFTGEVHVCQLTETDGDITGMLVGATTEEGGQSVEFGANGGRPPGSNNWTVQSGVTIDGAIAYMSSGGSVGTDGASVVYEGDFGKMKDDNSGFDDVGEGRLSATCP